MIAWINAARSALGLGASPADLTLLQVSLRGIIVFTTALVMVRCADRRFLSNKTAFDAILGLILASMLARAVNGSVAFFPTLGAGFVLVGFHRILGHLACRSHRFGNLIKGRSQAVIRDGIVDNRVMAQNNLTLHDLQEDLRLNGNVNDPQEIHLACHERNGQISVVKKGSENPILES